jgi:hypothetical protein
MPRKPDPNLDFLHLLLRQSTPIVQLFQHSKRRISWRPFLGIWITLRSSFLYQSRPVNGSHLQSGAFEPDSSPVKWNERRKPFDLSSDGPLDDIPSSDDHISPNKRPRIDDADLVPATERLANLGVESSSEDFDKYDDLSMDDFMEIDDDDLHPAIKKEAEEGLSQESHAQGHKPLLRRLKKQSPIGCLSMNLWL